MSVHAGPPSPGAACAVPVNAAATMAAAASGTMINRFIQFSPLSFTYPWTSVVSDPSKLHAGAPDRPAIVSVITRLWRFRLCRYWSSFWRSNFAVPTPFMIVHAMFWKRGSFETSASAMRVRRTLEARICARLARNSNVDGDRRARRRHRQRVGIEVHDRGRRRGRRTRLRIVGVDETVAVVVDESVQRVVVARAEARLRLDRCRDPVVVGVRDDREGHARGLRLAPARRAERGGVGARWPTPALGRREVDDSPRRRTRDSRPGHGPAEGRVGERPVAVARVSA